MINTFKVNAFGREFHVTEKDLVHLQHEGVISINNASGVNLAAFTEALTRSMMNAGEKALPHQPLDQEPTVSGRRGC
jgi:hypothetical protein